MGSNPFEIANPKASTPNSLPGLPAMPTPVANDKTAGPVTQSYAVVAGRHDEPARSAERFPDSYASSQRTPGKGPAAQGDQAFGRAAAPAPRPKGPSSRRVDHYDSNSKEIRSKRPNPRTTHPIRPGTSTPFRRRCLPMRGTMRPPCSSVSWCPWAPPGYPTMPMGNGAHGGLPGDAAISARRLYADAACRCRCRGAGQPMNYQGPDAA